MTQKKSKKLSFKAAVFDLDGVLTTSDKQHYLSFKTIHEKIPGFDEYTQVDYKNFARGVAREEVFRLTLKNRGLSYTQKQIVSWAKDKQALYLLHLQQTEVPVYTDAVRFAINLKQAGVKLAIGSTSKNTALILEKTGLKSLFEVIVAGDTVYTANSEERVELKGKPEPDIFLEAVKRLGVNPKQAVGFEDAINGIKALERAGIFAVGINRDDSGSELKQAGAKIVIENLKKLDIQSLSSAFNIK